MTMNECRDRSRRLGSYLDGELEAATLIEIDEHVARCDSCREEAQLLRAMRGSLKRVVRGAAPSGLRERIGNAMAAERAREDARATDAEAEAFAATAPIVHLATWRSMVPLATAAALALMWGAATRSTQQQPTSEVHAGLGDELLAELVAEHAQPLPFEATDRDAVRGLERYIGVPVRSGSFERAGAHLVGGRVVPLHSQRAAILQYELGKGQRVSVLVYDAEKIQVGIANLAPRGVGTAEVRVGQSKGYSVVVAQRAGVGYVLASDLDADKSAQFAATVYDDQR
jgi:anti-sigma factor (TIGR02949 family)